MANKYVKLIQELKKIPGAISYDGEVSIQVLLPTMNGKHLRVGVSDDVPGVWHDYYAGLPIDKEGIGEIRAYEKTKI
jgi:hypothetical protein